MSAVRLLKIYTYKRPARLREMRSAHGLVEVWRDGQAIGLLNRTTTGYAVRDLDGKLLDRVNLHDRDTAAACLWSIVKGECEA